MEHPEKCAGATKKILPYKLQGGGFPWLGPRDGAMVLLSRRSGRASDSPGPGEGIEEGSRVVVLSGRSSGEMGRQSALKPPGDAPQVSGVVSICQGSYAWVCMFFFKCFWTRGQMKQPGSACPLCGELTENHHAGPLLLHAGNHLKYFENSRKDGLWLPINKPLVD